MATIEQFSATNCPIGATVIPVTVTLVASDLLLVFYATGQGGGRTVAVTGLGTWTTFAGSANLQGDLASPKMQLFTLTGVTGTGNVTLTVVGEQARAVLYVVRGLVAPAVANSIVGSTGGVINTVYGVGGPMQVTADQVLLSFATTSAGGTPITFSFPDTGSIPSVGDWTVDNATIGVGWTVLAAHANASISPTAMYQTMVKRLSGSAFQWGSLSLVLGEVGTSTVAVHSTYAEVPSVGSPAAALEVSYAEVPLRGSPATALESSYIEIIAPALLATQLDTLYVEVVSVLSPEAPFIGWGNPRI